jgi:uncharacterized protein (UPF0335 family)
MQFTTGGYDLAIPVPMSTAGRPVQVFSRPLLTEDDLYYMGPGTLGFARLLTIKLEPRVWKILIERFPGRDALRGPNQKPPAAASATAAKSLADELKQEGRDQPFRSPALFKRDSESSKEVTDLPIPSPGMGGGDVLPYSSQRSVSSQRSHQWSDLSDNRTSHKERSVSGKEPEETGSVYSSSVKARLNRFSRRVQEKPEFDSDLSDDSDVPRLNSFRDVGRMFKRIEESHKAKLKQLKERVSDLESDKASLSRQLKEAQEGAKALLDPQSLDFQEYLKNLDEIAFKHITERVYKLIKLDPQHITRADLPSGDQAAADQALEARVVDLENDVFNAAGALPSLADRVERLELSRSATSVEMGGFVFTDEASVDAWLAPMNDPRLNRFCVDFTILFLLAEPKFESISQCLEQTAAAKKAHFEC